MSVITVSLPDGQAKEVDAGTTVAGALAELLSKKQAKRALAARTADGQLLDLSRPLAVDTVLTSLAEDAPESLAILRHSTAHIMAAAVRELFGPGVKVAIGPAIDNGFYYDFDRAEPFTPEDFEAIEARMRELIAQALPFVREEMDRAAAIALFRELDEPYKVELLEELTEPIVSVYRQGSFLDLCRGPHIPHSGWIRAFKLTQVAGAYWRGDETRPMLQRLYGTAFFEEKALKAHLAALEEAKRRDHRRLGKDLELFAIQDGVGPGLILWQPKGALVRRLIEDHWKEMHNRHGYELLYTPHIARLDLWRRSGHLDFYSENMYAPMAIDEVPYQLKPMNCPFHIAIYKVRRRSYRELPIRWCELGTVYRYERTGVLHGLMRVRGFTQDDAHIFCRPDQLEDEIFNILDLNLQVLSTFGFDQYDIYLSTRPEKYVGSDEHWQQATDALRLALEKKGMAYAIDPGEGVFYGPKIDIKIKDVLGRAWQCSTIQVDFNLPERFDIGYTGEDGQEHRPIMVHRALMGSLERFFGVLIEHYAGAFPVWLAPVQARLLTVTDEQADYAQAVHRQLQLAGCRVELDLRNEKLGYKIREAQLGKVPYMVVIGDKEKADGTLTVRLRDGQNLPAMTPAAFLELVGEESRRARGF
ncbi:MAG: threonine--tRNA ligase [Thermodesulfobacteriota bacterium]